jgi:hypothetical protein
MEKYPHECSRCGMCCLIETCPICKGVHKTVNGVCPELSFSFDIASCNLVKTVGKDTLGIGQGCCISAKIFAKGKEYDFASLPPALKTLAVRQRRSNSIGVLNKKGEQI